MNDDAETRGTYGHEPCYEELRAELVETKRKLKLRELGIEDPNAEVPIPEKPIIPLCHHVRENGKLCRSAAVSNRDYCYFHLSQRGRRLKMARARAHRRPWYLELPALEDLHAVQVGIMHVLEALTRQSIDQRSAALMLCGLRAAGANLRAADEVWERSRFDNVQQIDWTGFEQEHGLPQGFDPDTPPEVAFPPPQEPAAPTVSHSVGPQGESLVTEPHQRESARIKAEVERPPEKTTAPVSSSQAGRRRPQGPAQPPKVGPRQAQAADSVPASPVAQAPVTTGGPGKKLPHRERRTESRNQSKNASRNEIQKKKSRAKIA